MEKKIIVLTGYGNLTAFAEQEMRAATISKSLLHLIPFPAHVLHPSFQIQRGMELVLNRKEGITYVLSNSDYLFQGIRLQACRDQVEKDVEVWYYDEIYKKIVLEVDSTEMYMKGFLIGTHDIDRELIMLQRDREMESEESARKDPNELLYTTSSGFEIRKGTWIWRPDFAPYEFLEPIRITHNGLNNMYKLESDWYLYENRPCPENTNYSPSIN